VSADEGEFHFVGGAMVTIFLRRPFPSTVLLAHFVGVRTVWKRG
jgi:hypothetical protein